MSELITNYKTQRELKCRLGERDKTLKLQIKLADDYKRNNKARYSAENAGEPYIPMTPTKDRRTDIDTAKYDAVQMLSPYFLRREDAVQVVYDLGDEVFDLIDLFELFKKYYLLGRTNLTASKFKPIWDVFKAKYKGMNRRRDVSPIRREERQILPEQSLVSAQIIREMEEKKAPSSSGRARLPDGIRGINDNLTKNELTAIAQYYGVVIDEADVRRFKRLTRDAMIFRIQSAGYDSIPMNILNRIGVDSPDEKQSILLSQIQSQRERLRPSRERELRPPPEEKNPYIEAVRRRRGVIEDDKEEEDDAFGSGMIGYGRQEKSRHLIMGQIKAGNNNPRLKQWLTLKSMY
jgi:hypothetical protein